MAVTEDLTEYLTDHGVTFRRGAGAELVAHCMFCNEAKRVGKLYLNTSTWLYSCKLCGESGNRRTLLRHFGDDDTVTYLPGTDPMVRRQVLTDYAAMAADLLAGNDRMMMYLLDRGLDAETIVDGQFGYVPRGVSVSGSLPAAYKRADLEMSGMVSPSGKEFHAGRVTIPYLSSRSVLQVRGKDPEGKYFTPAGDHVRLYNEDALRGADDVLITEGEFDCRIVEQHLCNSGDLRLRRTAVVGLAGAGALPGGAEGFPDFFRDAKRVFIGLDPDPTGVREAAKIRGLLGSKARVVDLPQGDAVNTAGGVVKLDWTEFLRAPNADHPYGGHDWRDLATLLTAADMTGKRIYSMADAAVRYAREQAERPGITLGFPTLDAIIRPGLRPGNLMIPLAKTGGGKSQFLANIAWNTRSRRVLYISLETTATEVYLLLRRISRFWGPAGDDRDMLTSMPHLRIVDENRLSPEDLDLLVAEYTQEVGEPPELVFVDYLGYYARGMKGGSPYEKVSAGVMQLKSEAKRLELAIIAPHQVNRGAKEGMPFTADEARDSVTGDTWVTLADGRREQIATLVGGNPDVMALGNNFQFAVRPAVKVWAKAKREVFAVTTQSGRRIKVTAEHPFLTLDGWRPLADLKPGDSIAVPERLEVFGDQPLPNAQLLGHLIANAHLSVSPVSYTTGNTSIREHVGELASRTGVQVHGKKGEPLTVVFPAGGTGRVPNPLTDYLRGLGDVWGVKSPQRVVPAAVWRAPRGDVAAFLQGLWSDDGCVTNRGVMFSSASEELARGVQALLVRFGIHSFLTHEAYSHGGYKEGFYWRVSVREARALVLFAKEIGLAGDKGMVLEDLALTRANARSVGGTCRSLPVEVWDHIHRVRHRKHITWERAFGNWHPQTSRRLTVEKVREVAERLDDQWLRDVSHADVRFETITTVADAGVEMVYDITVRGLSNFVANEVTVKNSGVVEETGDFVLGLFRPGDSAEGGATQANGGLSLSILKSRRGGRGRVVNLKVSAASLVIVDALDRKASVRLDQENSMVNRGVSYEDIFAAERADAFGAAQLRLVR